MSSDGKDSKSNTNNGPTDNQPPAQYEDRPFRNQYRNRQRDWSNQNPDGPNQNQGQWGYGPRDWSGYGGHCMCGCRCRDPESGPGCMGPRGGGYRGGRGPFQQSSM
ncbi:hypothetical protein LSH36_90g02137 [Paralvinella palmiformis]|uniref:Uncharacterized protein n=1 Tax=Paralvinella palmiformis TaxID=53620 RepID=A0AAD9K0Y4_9ANNE|nr:hypothetical protein LSH36_90g02137 [Paralvinella palmiformis]